MAVSPLISIAQDRNRTCTVLLPLGPQPSASASSATWAQEGERIRFHARGDKVSGAVNQLRRETESRRCDGYGKSLFAGPPLSLRWSVWIDFRKK